MAYPSIPSQETLCYKLGPAGSEAEKEQWDLKGKTEIAQIFISYGDGISSIQFQYVDNGRFVLSPIFGNSCFSGSCFQKIKLDHPSEYITGIEGRFSSTCIDAIEFIINKCSLGKLGCFQYNLKMKPFKFRFEPENQFGGFHGSHDSNFLTSIGVYFYPLIAIDPTTTVRGDDLRRSFGQKTYDNELEYDDGY